MCLYYNSERCLLPYNAAKALQDKMVETVCTERLDCVLSILAEMQDSQSAQDKVDLDNLLVCISVCVCVCARVRVCMLWCVCVCAYADMHVCVHVRCVIAHACMRNIKNN